MIQENSPVKTTRRRSGQILTLLGLTGMLVGAGLVIGAKLSLSPVSEMFGVETSLPPSAFIGEDVLLEARSDDLSYRASSFGIQPGSGLHRTIMAEQAGILNAYQAAASANRTDTSPPWRVETYFTRTATAGPMTSILRTDYISAGDEAHRLEFASSLISELHPDGLDLADLFSDERSTGINLDRILCRAVARVKYAQNPDARIDGEPIFCNETSPVSFLNGAPVVFAGSTETNAFGGLTFYYAPGRIGDIEEGEYIIDLPQTAFRSYLKPEFLSLFQGIPPRLRQE